MDPPQTSHASDGGAQLPHSVSCQSETMDCQGSHDHLDSQVCYCRLIEARFLIDFFEAAIDLRGHLLKCFRTHAAVGEQVRGYPGQNPLVVLGHDLAENRALLRQHLLKHSAQLRSIVATDKGESIGLTDRFCIGHGHTSLWRTAHHEAFEKRLLRSPDGAV